jgi:hypothetical protein
MQQETDDCQCKMRECGCRRPQVLGTAFHSLEGLPNPIREEQLAVETPRRVIRSFSTDDRMTRRLVSVVAGGMTASEKKQKCQ